MLSRPSKKSITTVLLLSATLLVASSPAMLCQAQDQDSLRILSYNIHHGEGTDRRLDLDRIAAVISKCKADIVALQEVDQNAKRSNSIAQAQYLADKLNMRFAFGANIALQGGHYGNAVLSRFEILKSENHLLPNLNNGEQRGVLVSKIAIPGKDQPVTLLATHFDHRREGQERLLSAKAINRLIVDKSKLMILAGDLNTSRASKPLIELEKHWQHVSANELPTVPVSKPTRQIDFILFRPASACKVISNEVLSEQIASDHRAILTVLELQ